ncbi:hypothetical protein KSD_76250 [Ktedonobacter sp. SOSP1-85]|uniref:serine/threonine protein kinase n=1 Tax=Ktedonobacter sp. SOSP1-85 TaxID=2778367 RepID=UPI0019168145|nr:serine/threonine-protein kinase [Ktedonobacter sp. SOSP1-85]GHO79854.1 hypothetical protein KSD_76250 [Ktedonobacter sp. SOSP1-85]
MVNYKEHLGNYRLLKPLGESKLARVYLAEHIHLGTQAVIKVLHTRELQEEHGELFKQEAYILAHLEHPHILRILNFDLDEGMPFLVMSYASGGSLQMRHPSGSRVPLPQVNDYVQQIASALQYAHKQKIIHRNVKPKNLLIGAHGEILLTDFSIASQSRSMAGGIVGTPTYAAPEQMYQQAVAASDQYALGIIVYEWLCGHVPFQGTFAEILSQHYSAPVPSLRQQTGLSSAIENVVLRALEKEPEQRFPSLQAFAKAFQDAVDQQERAARRISEGKGDEPSSAEQTAMVLRETDEEDTNESEQSPAYIPSQPLVEGDIKHFPLFRGAPRWRDILVIPGYIVSLVLLILLAYILRPPSSSGVVTQGGALSPEGLSTVLFIFLLWVFIGIWMLLAGAMLGWWRGCCAMFLTGLLLYILYPQALGPILVFTSTTLLCACLSGVLLEYRQYRRQHSFLASWGILSLAFLLSSSWMMFLLEIVGGPFLSPSLRIGEGGWMFMYGPLGALVMSAIDCAHCLGGGLFLAPLVAGIEVGLAQLDNFRKVRMIENE